MLLAIILIMNYSSQGLKTVHYLSKFYIFKQICRVFNQINALWIIFLLKLTFVFIDYTFIN